MSTTANTFDEFMDRYGPENGPEGVVRFIQEVFGVTLDPWQIKVTEWVGNRERRISIRACHGPGKTFLAACLAWYHLVCLFPQHTVVTAPSRAQLEGALVKEMLTLATKLPQPIRDLFTVKKNRIELTAAPSESWFEARTARPETPEALQGVHCDGGYVFLIADEASGIDEAIFESATGSMAGHNTTTLLLSNPVRSTGFFFESHQPEQAHLWKTLRVQASDSPRIPESFAQEVADMYGEGSAAYRIRVLGEFPAADADTIIPWEFIQMAQQRDLETPPDLGMIWAVDVARFGGDSNVLLKRSKLHVDPQILQWQGVDLMQTAGRVKAEWDGTPPSQRPAEILIDEIGLGAGVVDRLRELNLPVRGINVSETASVSGKYMNLRTELWFKARDWLAGKNRKLPLLEEAKSPAQAQQRKLHIQFAKELALLKYEFSSSGKLKAESKKDMKKRTKQPSPNLADAFVLSFASEPASLLHGSKNSMGAWNVPWNEPVSRNLAMF